LYCREQLLATVYRNLNAILQRKIPSKEKHQRPGSPITFTRKTFHLERSHESLPAPDPEGKINVHPSRKTAEKYLKTSNLSPGHEKAHIPSKKNSRRKRKNKRGGFFLKIGKDHRELAPSASRTWVMIDSPRRKGFWSSQEGLFEDLLDQYHAQMALRLRLYRTRRTKTRKSRRYGLASFGL